MDISTNLAVCLHIIRYLP